MADFNSLMVQRVAGSMHAHEVLNSIAHAVHAMATEKGFHDAPVPVGNQCANLHGEVSELWEAYRESRLNVECDKGDKMREASVPVLTCAEEELADIVIRALDTAVELRVDIGRAVVAKMAFNATRSHRHGGKVA